MPWQVGESETLVEPEQAMLHCALRVEVLASIPATNRDKALSKTDVLVKER
ncbi:MAG: hypothetical protein IPN76_12780 [Saprospiraceae bacterium]|nr:hypothetical protein [Saprospiraceae bacterium]